jgi:heme/copper-type cytochrome/quinol oxidase subunit 2
METLKFNFDKIQQKKALRALSSFLFMMVVLTVQAMAEVNLAEEKEKAAHNEFMSYVYMGVGFALVIFIAFYTTMKGKKDDKGSEDHKTIHHHPITHKHDHLHGRRGAPSRR